MGRVGTSGAEHDQVNFGMLLGIVLNGVFWNPVADFSFLIRCGRGGDELLSLPHGILCVSGFRV